MLALFVAAVLSAAPERPRLGVVIVVDQLSAEAFDARFEATKGGMRRMVRDGVRFRELRYDSAPSVTSAGHATLATGTNPEDHGVVANEWFDTERNKWTLSTEDARYQVLGRAPSRDGTAPSSLRTGTLSEAVKASNDRAKSVVISAKDRSAICSAGTGADAVIWFDAEAPIFTTSTYYAKELPAWVAPTNAKLAQLIKDGVVGGPGAKREGDREPFAEQTKLQPILDAMEVDLALAAVKALSLGQDEVPDLLTVSFSGHDRIGHAFGPDSPEGLSEFLTVDTELGRLFEGLDAAVGKGKYVAVFTSDHGVAPIPELAKTRKLDAGRIDTHALNDLLEKEADTALGAGDWFMGYKTPGLFVTPANRAKVHGIDGRLRALARQQPGVADLLPLPSLLAGALPGTAAELFRRGAVVDRSPDFIIVPKPYWTYGLGDHTGHSSHLLYDRAVPLVWFGAGVKKGTASDADAIDVAPTMSKLLGVPQPANARGHALSAVFP